VEAPEVLAELFDVIGRHDLVGAHAAEVVDFGERRRERRDLTAERAEH
jgi:hypothetical protein